MKPRFLILTGLAAALGAGLVPARTWTSADGQKTFEGELEKYYPEAGKVSVTMASGKSLTFDVAKLSEDDRKWLGSQPKEDGDPPAPRSLADQKIGSKLAKPGVLQKLGAKRYARFDLEKVPEYYILYFSASW